MKKKLLAVLSLLIIAAFVLVACAPAAPEEPEVRQPDFVRKESGLELLEETIPKPEVKGGHAAALLGIDKDGNAIRDTAWGPKWELPKPSPISVMGGVMFEVPKVDLADVPGGMIQVKGKGWSLTVVDTDGVPTIATKSDIVHVDPKEG